MDLPLDLSSFHNTPLKHARTAIAHVAGGVAGDEAMTAIGAQTAYVHGDFARSIGGPGGR